MKKRAKEIIETLSANKFYGECPCCGETIPLGIANLFYSDKFNKSAKETYESYRNDLKEQKMSLKELKKGLMAKSETSARAINIGLIMQRMFPSLREFPYCCEDCRSLFEPVDYLVFKGLANKGKVEKLLWIEIKTGGSRLNPHQKEIKSLVENKKLFWDTYEIGDDND